MFRIKPVTKPNEGHFEKTSVDDVLCCKIVQLETFN